MSSDSDELCFDSHVITLRNRPWWYVWPLDRWEAVFMWPPPHKGISSVAYARTRSGAIDKLRSRVPRHLWYSSDAPRG